MQAFPLGPFVILRCIFKQHQLQNQNELHCKAQHHAQSRRNNGGYLLFSDQNQRQPERLSSTSTCHPWTPVSPPTPSKQSGGEADRTRCNITSPSSLFTSQPCRNQNQHQNRLQRRTLQKSTSLRWEVLILLLNMMTRTRAKPNKRFFESC